MEKKNPSMAVIILLGVLLLITSRMTMAMAKSGAGNPLKIDTDKDFFKVDYKRCVYFENKNIYLTGHGTHYVLTGRNPTDKIPINVPLTDFALVELDDDSLMIITLNGFIPFDINDIPENWTQSSYGYVMEPMGEQLKAIDGIVSDISYAYDISLEAARNLLHADYYIDTIKQRPKNIFAPTLAVTVILSVILLLLVALYINPELINKLKAKKDILGD